MDSLRVESHTYEARWPEPLDPQLESCWKKVARVAFDILSVLIFPIGLARLAAWGTRTVAIKMLQTHLKGRGETSEWQQSNGDQMLEKAEGRRVPLKTPTGIQLDAAYIPRSKEQAVIYFPGVYGKWQRCSQHGSEEHIEATGASVLMVNSRWHTHDNPFADEEGLALDGYTAFDYLIQQGFSPDNIVFMGHSMGGAVATLGAGLAQEAFPDADIKLVNWCSYHSLASTFKSLVLERTKLPFHLEKIVCHIVYWVLRMAGNIDVSSALERVKSKAVIWNAADGTIFGPAQTIKKATRCFSFEMKTWGQEPRREPLSAGADTGAHLRTFTNGEGLALQAILHRFFNLPTDEHQDAKFARYVTVI